MLGHSAARARRPLLVIAAILMAAGGLVSGIGVGLPRAAAVDSSSDIPGVELPGPVAAGRLGGAIYDVVYRLVVQPGHVIVAGLTGTDGTDFDIYLFDATATTVLSPTGLLTKSAGPTSTESLSWPSRLGGVYYIDLNGATDVEGDFRLTVQTVPDPTPPTASITLAGGRASINQVTIPVSITAIDDLSGVVEMAFSVDGKTFEDWLPFQAATTRTVLPGDGPRAVWVKVRNGVGLESAPAVDTITIDTSAPSVIALDPAPGTTVIGLRPTFSVSFNEPINPGSWTDLGLVVQLPTGTLVSGTYSYDAVRRIGTFVPSSDLQAGTVYVVNVGLVRDIAGNAVAPLASWSIVPLTPTGLEAVASPAVVAVGGTTHVHVAATGTPEPTTVELSSSVGGSPFQAVSSFELVNGQVSLSLVPVASTTYRFRYAGAFGIAPAQADARVLVRRSITLAGRSAAVVARGRVGTAVKLTAVVAPAGAGAPVSFRLYRFDPARRAWVYAGSHGKKTDASGRATYSWTPTGPGSYYWRATVATTPDFANNITPVYRWSISR